MDSRSFENWSAAHDAPPRDWSAYRVAPEHYDARDDAARRIEARKANESTGSLET